MLNTFNNKAQVQFPTLDNFSCNASYMQGLSQIMLFYYKIISM